MSTLLSAALAARAVLVIVLLTFASRAWIRVRDGRTGFLVLAFVLFLTQAAILFTALSGDLPSVVVGVTIGTFIELGAFVALYLALLRP